MKVHLPNNGISYAGVSHVLCTLRPLFVNTIKTSQDGGDAANNNNALYCEIIMKCIICYTSLTTQN